MRRIYLDTCIVIYFIERHPDFSEMLETLISQRAEDEFCFSPLVEMECMVIPLRTQNHPLKVLFAEFFSAQTQLAISNGVFQIAAKLRADFPSLKTPDALHLATALHYGCDEFWSNDGRLNMVAPGLVKNIFASEESVN
ncbi:hypothetical protein BH10ACI3_BH10ACI3_24150 [soil metagenome]